MLGYLASIYWIVIANIPFDFIQDGIPKSRNFFVGIFLVFFVATLIFYWLELLTFIPRADKEYPLVSNGTLRLVFSMDMYFGLGLPALLFGGLLMLASFMKSHGSVTHLDHLWYGVGMFALGALSMFWGKFPPKFFMKVPSDDETMHAYRLRVAAYHRHMQPRQAAIPEDKPEEYATPVQAVQPKIDFSNIYGMQAIKDKLLEPAQLIVAKRSAQDASEPPANGILLHGEPGNGKTVFGEALAGELMVPFIALTYGDVSSKWVGERPRVIVNCFAYAKRNAPCVLFVDEIDSFIRSRDSNVSNEESFQIVNTILTEIVNLRNHRVVLIGATNYLANLDTAAIREGRFDYKIEITPPDEEARIGIIEKGVAKHAQHLNVDHGAMIAVAKRWNGFSVSRLLAVVKALPRYAKDNNLTDIGHKELMGALREVQGRNGRIPQDTKSISELVLDNATREALTMVSSRLKDVQRIESLGGTLPSGVLFHGPSGTGKTAAARALAKEVGWAFLSVAGPDLIADREKITKLYAEAKDIRPTIIFIDEADDVLRNRQYIQTPDLTNRMLVLMDGTDEKVKDVVFIAATNNPDQIDPALLRAGRFTEKVEFMPPPVEQIPRHVSAWLNGKGVMLEASLDAWEVANMLEGQTIANIEGVLQYALNRAISKQLSQEPLVMTLDDINSGMRIVLQDSLVSQND